MKLIATLYLLFSVLACFSQNRVREYFYQELQIRKKEQYLFSGPDTVSIGSFQRQKNSISEKEVWKNQNRFILTLERKKHAVIIKAENGTSAAMSLNPEIYGDVFIGGRTYDYVLGEKRNQWSYFFNGNEVIHCSTLKANDKYLWYLTTREQSIVDLDLLIIASAHLAQKRLHKKSITPVLITVPLAILLLRSIIENYSQ